MRDHAVHRTDHELVQHGQGVAHRTAASAHRQLEHAGLGLDVLPLADVFQIGAHHLGRHETERIVVGTRADRADHLVRLGRREDEHDVLRRLLHDFEERVEALRRDHVSLVEDEDLVAVARGGETCSFAQFTRVVHAVVRGGIDLHHVDGAGAAGGEVLAGFAFAARMRSRALRAVHTSGEDARRTGLATAARAGEQVGVRELALVEGAHERDRDLVLTDHPREGVGSITAVQRQSHR